MVSGTRACTQNHHAMCLHGILLFLFRLFERLFARGSICVGGGEGVKISIKTSSCMNLAQQL